MPRVAALLLSVAALLTLPPATRGDDSGAGDGVPPERLARLARGVNLSHWFAQNIGNDCRPEYLDTWVTARDAERIRALGFTYVRLPFNPNLLQRDPHLAQPTDLDADMLARLGRAIDLLLAADLAVMVDVHPDEEFQKALREDPDPSDTLRPFWGVLATGLAKTDPERVFLEVMNEPVFNDAGRWWRVQGAALASMRRSAPRHTFVAGGDMWGRIETLVEMAPYAHDRNIVYAFHCYEPFNFTHQGASWSAEPTRSLKRVPYPIVLEIAEQVAPLQATEELKGAVWQLGHERWNYPKLKALVARAAAWGKEHGVPVVCTEFGAHRGILPEHRFNYLRDFRTACEATGVPWAVWDYAGQFGIVTGDKPEARQLDEMSAEALDLKTTQ